MAFSNAPVQDTYSTVRIPLIQSETSDPISATNGISLTNMMINVLPKKETNPAGNDGWMSISRPAILATAAPAGVSSGQIRGLYVWEKTITAVYYFVVIGTLVFTATNVAGPFVAVTALATNTTTPVRFTEFISSTNVKSLVLCDGVEGYVYTTNAAGTKIVDADFPSTHVPFPIFLNGRLYLAKGNTGDIYCSDLDNPASWTPGNFISSEVYPDDIQALVKLDNYILAIGLVGCEFFYDAGIATGSPMARVENATLPFGTDYANSIASTFNQLCFLSKSPDGNIVVQHVEGFKHTEIPCNFLNQLIPQIITTVGLSTIVVGHFFRDGGELYYNIAIDNTKNSDTVGVCSLSFTYCFSAKMWVQFTRGKDINRDTYGTNAYKSYPVFFSCPGYGGFQTLVAGQAFNAPFIGLLSETNTGADSLYINSTSPTTIYYPSTVTVSELTFGTLNRKFMHRLGIDYINDSDDSVSTTWLPRVTIWDYPTAAAGATARAFTSGFQQGNGTGLDYPFLTQLGSFRQRWIKVETYGSLRYRYIEVNINKGHM